MLAKKHKLTKQKDFDNTFKNGKASFDSILGIKVINNDLPESRFGIMVSTKISKKAVDRNKIKRQIRSVIEKELDNIKQGKDIIIITLPAILNKTFQEIEKSIKNNLTKLKII